MSTIKIEVPQIDGITVKERIIRFFEKGANRQEAEDIYDACEANGMSGGNTAFDAAVTLACKWLELDSEQLAAEIKDHS